MSFLGNLNPFSGKNWEALGSDALGVGNAIAGSGPGKVLYPGAQEIIHAGTNPENWKAAGQALSGAAKGDVGQVIQSFGGGAGVPAKKPAAKPASKPSSPSSDPASKNLYGFDPLSMANIFTTTIAPYVAANSKALQGDIANYGTEMKQALAGASPQYAAAYKVSMPAMQQALSMQNQAASNFVATSPAVDALIQNLAAVQNAAKAAGTYYSYSLSPYNLQSSTGLLGANPSLPAVPTSTPFTYGTPGTTAALQTAQAQQALTNQQQLQAWAAGLAGSNPNG